MKKSKYIESMSRQTDGHYRKMKQLRAKHNSEVNLLKIELIESQDRSTKVIDMLDSVLDVQDREIARLNTVIHYLESRITNMESTDGE